MWKGIIVHLWRIYTNLDEHNAINEIQENNLITKRFVILRKDKICGDAVSLFLIYYLFFISYNLSVQIWSNKKYRTKISAENNAQGNVKISVYDLTVISKILVAHWTKYFPHCAVTATPKEDVNRSLSNVWEFSERKLRQICFETMVSFKSINPPLSPDSLKHFEYPGKTGCEINFQSVVYTSFFPIVAF